MNRILMDILELIEDATIPNMGHSQANYKGMRLSSAFQPIFSLSHCRVVGYEGLIRAFDEHQQALPVWRIFEQAITEAEIVELDRLSRALHMHNFMQQGQAGQWLFLNINPQVIVNGRHYGQFFQDLLEHYGVSPSMVVVEIIEGAIEDESQLSESVQFYKNLGCLVAIDDFGAGHSNFERIWRLSPDIVKLDRSMITQAASTAVARRVLPGVVSLIHEAGSLVLIEGVETEQEAIIAMDTDVDLVQGYYFGRPAPYLLQETRSESIAKLFQGYRQSTVPEIRHQKMQDAVAAFLKASEQLEAGAPLSGAVQALLAIPGVDRCYLLNQQGVQIGTSEVAPSRRSIMSVRYQPLADGSGANWIRRPYLRRALGNPGEVQMTRPYLSIATGELCLTISIAIKPMGVVQVLCCDLDWDVSA